MAYESNVEYGGIGFEISAKEYFDIVYEDAFSNNALAVCSPSSPPANAIIQS